MKILFLLPAVILTASLSAEAMGCYSRKDVKGRDDLAKSVRKATADEATKLYEKFCTDNADKVTCVTKEVPNKEAVKTRGELMKGKSCGEVTAIRNKDKGTTTLFFVDSAKK